MGDFKMLIMIVIAVVTFGVILVFMSATIGDMTGSMPLGIIISIVLFFLIAFQDKIESSLTNKTANTIPSKPQYDFGKYSEPLKSGGKLVVTLHNWSIQYSFPGPDRRYNWTFLEIESYEITSYINAWKENFSEYLNLKRRLRYDGSITKTGLKNMCIRAGAYPQGVCILGNHMPICTEEKLNLVISDYMNASERAKEIQRILSDPDCKDPL